MSIDHKAWLFDHDAFEAELAGTLEAALKSGSTRALKQFVQKHRAALTDIETEEPLEAGWEDRVDATDVQALADLALTKYYDLAENLGLGPGFDALGAYLKTVPRVGPKADVLLCGRLFGPRGKRLDSGCMGTGLVPTQEAARLFQLLDATDWPPIPDPDADLYAECYYPPEDEEEVQESLDVLVEIYRRASAEGKGILFTDFNDQGVGHR